MLFNYFKVASRLIVRNKTYSAITIFGLAFGLSSAILLFLWIHKEFTYDQFHTDSNRLFVAWNRELNKGQFDCWPTTPRVLAPTLAQEYTAVESATSYGVYGSKHLFTVGDKRIVKNTGAFVDASFLTMFSMPMIKGNVNRALTNPNSIVLTEKFAHELFGEKNAFGEDVSISEAGHTFPFTVTGILKDLPFNTDFHFDYLISWQFVENSLGEKDTYWGNNSVTTYIKLKTGEDVDSFNKVVKNIAKTHAKEGSSVEVFLYPLSKMRLYSHFENGIQSGGRIQIIRMLAALGFILVTVACINFVNLSTARAQKRAKEIGIRKVTGAMRFSLVVQFLCESVLISFGAGIISLLIAYLALPGFSTLVKQPLSLEFYNPFFWLLWVSFIILVGVLAGLYPACYLSSFRPVRVLTGAPIVRSNRNTFRQSLVVLQFGFAVIMIVSIIVVTRQVRFIQNRQAGYAKDHLIYIPLTGDLRNNNVALKNDLLSSGVAVSVSRTSASITEQWSGTSGITWVGKDEADKTDIERFIVDDDIVKTAGLVLKAGRDFDLQDYSTDSTAVLLNEASVKLMGFEQPIGEKIVDGDTEYHVIGVVKDFVFLSPYQKIGPMVIEGAAHRAFAFGTLHIRLNTDFTSQQSIAAIERMCRKYNSSYPFEYQFVDEEYQRKFDGILTTQMISSVFGFTAVFIACLGLLGLSTFMIETRVKEIGIRKVMGSSVINIIRLLSWDTLKPILVAIVLFSPVAWWCMKWWLQTFDYRIALDGWMFIFAGVIILAIALATVIWQAKGAAQENPVKSLRAN